MLFYRPFGRTPAPSLRGLGGDEGRPARRRPGRQALGHRPRHRRPGPSRAAQWRRPGRARPGAPPEQREAFGKKSTPEVIDAINQLMEHDTAGDPVSGRQMGQAHQRTRSPERCARPASPSVCPNTVAKLLKGK